MKRISILFVCTGNICRSPLAEGIFQTIAAKAGMAGHYHVDSAGTGGWHAGEKPDHRSIRTAAGHGVDITGQRARQIRESDFSEFDLIIGMDHTHITALRRMAPVAENLHLFGTVAFGTDEEIPDPYYGPQDDFDYVYTRLFAGCTKLLETLGAAKAS
jgi:protein-tyrosine phosphatase